MIVTGYDLPVVEERLWCNGTPGGSKDYVGQAGDTQRVLQVSWMKKRYGVMGPATRTL